MVYSMGPTIYEKPPYGYHASRGIQVLKEWVSEASVLLIVVRVWWGRGGGGYMSSGHGFK